ncbi:MAG: 2-C-methyl-D-erythritol 4-phosphate cytidylyltransferase [Deltaproteobacteria bacterium]|nr:2-C-methyl-D-erythritol 4-phosphate cytidylyltransferase [Deltaproteobacteria bacterium]
MIGVIVVFPVPESGVQPVGPGRELLGAPLVARAIAAACPVEQQVRAAVAVPASDLELVRDEIVPRYGLTEVIEVFAVGSDFVATLRRGLEIVGSDVELVLVHDGRRPLVTHDLCSRAVELAREHGGAALALRPGERPVRWLDGQQLERQAEPIALLQSPQAARADAVARAVEQAAPDAADLVALLVAAGVPVAAVAGDRDNLLVSDEADLARCIEVWSRRAVDYPFLWPRPDRIEAVLEPSAEAEGDAGETAAAAADEILVGAGEGEAGPLDSAIASAADDQEVAAADEVPAGEAGNVD